MSGPLEGITVLDVSQLAVGPWAGTLLGQLGAEVIKIEEPKGDPIKNLLPWMNGVGTYYTSVNLNKKDISLDLKNPEDMQIALQLAERVDVFLENFRPGVMDRLGLGYDALKKINPLIVYCSSSGYGSRGPRRYEGSADGYARSFTGFDSVNGPQGGPAENFRNKGHIDHTSSTFIVQAILAGLMARERYGIGQKVETSMMQATMTYQTSRIAEYFATGTNPEPMGSAISDLVPHQAFQTKDNFVAIGINTQQQWEEFCGAIEMSELARDTKFANNADRIANRDSLISLLNQVFAGKNTKEWIRILEKKNVPCGPFLSFQDLVDNPQVSANEMVATIEHPWGDVKVGGTPWKFSDTPADILPAPSLDQHREEVVQFIKETPSKNSQVAPVEQKLDSPLNGLVVIELSQGIAAPFASMQLGDLGAQVIKIEPSQGDWSRHVGVSVQDGDSPLFLALNRNKKSIVLDTSTPVDKKTLMALIRQADVFITDLQPKHAESLDLTHQNLKNANPRLVYCSVTPFGNKGPLRDKPGGEVVLQAMSDVWRYLGTLKEAPLRLGADAAAMAAGIFALHGTIAALFSREKLGTGQKVEVSQLGAMLALATQLNAAQSDPSLSGGWHLSAPTDPPSHNPMAKDLPVDFGFMARNPGGWPLFCKTLGIPEEVATDPRFSEGLGRVLNEEALNPILESCFKNKTAAALKKIIEEDCGGVGVICNNYDTLFHDPQIKAMDMLGELEHPRLGKIKTMGLPWNLEKTPGSLRLPPPSLGQHTEEIQSAIGNSHKLA